MTDERIFCREVWRKPGGMFHNKPLLLFVSKGFAFTKTDGAGIHYVKISGIQNPLPFKRAYDINLMHIDSWLKNHGWEKIGSENIFP